MTNHEYDLLQPLATQHKPRKNSLTISVREEVYADAIERLFFSNINGKHSTNTGAFRIRYVIEYLIGCALLGRTQLGGYCEVSQGGRLIQAYHSHSLPIPSTRESAAESPLITQRYTSVCLMGAYGIEASNTSKDECPHNGHCIWSLLVEMASNLTCSI